jgi:hypothetical protein
MTSSIMARFGGFVYRLALPRMVRSSAPYANPFFRSNCDKSQAAATDLEAGCCTQYTVLPMRSNTTDSITLGINSLLNLHKPVRNRLFSQSAGLLQVEHGFQPCGKSDAQQRILQRKLFHLS